MDVGGMGNMGGGGVRDILGFRLSDWGDVGIVN